MCHANLQWICCMNVRLALVSIIFLLPIVPHDSLNGLENCEYAFYSVSFTVSTQMPFALENCFSWDQIQTVTGLCWAPKLWPDVKHPKWIYNFAVIATMGQQQQQPKTLLIFINHRETKWYFPCQSRVSPLRLSREVKQLKWPRSLKSFYLAYAILDWWNGRENHEYNLFPLLPPPSPLPFSSLFPIEFLSYRMRLIDGLKIDPSFRKFSKQPSSTHRIFEPLVVSALTCKSTTFPTTFHVFNAISKWFSTRIE